LGVVRGTNVNDAVEAGGLAPAQRLCAQLLPDRALVAIPQDDPLFFCHDDVGERDRALAHHCGGRILGLKDHGRWVVIFHPGDLLDGWRHAFEPRWQEVAIRFGVNVWCSASERSAARGAADP
jgi:hypothetical protein